MCDRGQLGWEGWRDAADEIAAQAEDPDYPTWVMVDAATGGLVGSVAVYDDCPSWAWSAAERTEACDFLCTVYTDPAYAGRQLAALMTAWARHRAAERRKPWVRLGMGPYPDLAAYYERIGWQLVRAAQRHGVTSYAMATTAEVQPQLTDLLHTAAGT
jgi:GNAT superfamily N-acetyltransferase